MAPYSMDLRERVVRAWDTSGDAEEVATTFSVSRAWVCARHAIVITCSTPS